MTRSRAIARGVGIARSPEPRRRSAPQSGHACDPHRSSAARAPRSGRRAHRGRGGRFDRSDGPPDGHRRVPGSRLACGDREPGPNGRRDHWISWRRRGSRQIAAMPRRFRFRADVPCVKAEHPRAARGQRPGPTPRRAAPERSRWSNLGGIARLPSGASRRVPPGRSRRDSQGSSRQAATCLCGVGRPADRPTGQARRPLPTTIADDPYKRLGVPRDATLGEIKKAHKRLAKR